MKLLGRTTFCDTDNLLINKGEEIPLFYLKPFCINAYTVVKLKCNSTELPCGNYNSFNILVKVAKIVCTYGNAIKPTIFYN